MSKKKLASTNPATGKLIQEYQQHDRDELAAIIQGAEKAAEEWSRTGFGERSALMMKAASNLRHDIEKYARLITTEMALCLNMPPVLQGQPLL